jgi:hypothetical protein
MIATNPAALHHNRRRPRQHRLAQDRLLRWIQLRSTRELLPTHHSHQRRLPAHAYWRTPAVHAPQSTEHAQWRLPVHAHRSTPTSSRPPAHSSLPTESSAPLSTKLVVVDASSSSPPSQHSDRRCNAVGRRQPSCPRGCSTGPSPSIQPWRAQDHVASCSMLNQISNRPRVTDDTGRSRATWRRRHWTRRHKIKSAAALSGPQSISLCCLRCFVDASISLNKSHCWSPLSVVVASPSSPPSHHQDYRSDVHRRFGCRRPLRCAVAVEPAFEPAVATSGSLLRRLILNGGP